MANYYSYFDDSAAGQNTRAQIDDESAIFGMGVSQDINCGIITARVGIKVSGIVTAIAGAAVTYYGDGQHLTGLTASELQVGADIRPRNVNASGITTVSTFKVGTGATIESSGNATLGILTASNATLGILTASSVICNATTIPFYPPVVTTTQRDAMTVTAGAMVFNSSTNMLNCFDGSSWKVVAFV